MKLKKFFSSNIREISLIIVMIALSVFIEIRSGGNFFTLENISDMFTETAVLAITAVGMMMVIITSGIDLSIGSIMALVRFQFHSRLGCGGKAILQYLAIYRNRNVRPTGR